LVQEDPAKHPDIIPPWIDSIDSKIPNPKVDPTDPPTLESPNLTGDVAPAPQAP